MGLINSAFEVLEVTGYKSLREKENNTNNFIKIGTKVHVAIKEYRKATAKGKV